MMPTRTEAILRQIDFLRSRLERILYLLAAVFALAVVALVGMILGEPGP